MEEIINDYEYPSLLADIEKTNYGYKEVIELWNAIDDESSTYEEYSQYDIARTIVFLINKVKEVEKENELYKLTIGQPPLYESEIIPKSKIKEKIEELNKEEKGLRNSISAEEYAEYSDSNISFDLMHIEIQRSVLQELMEDK